VQPVRAQRVIGLSVGPRPAMIMNLLRCGAVPEAQCIASPTPCQQIPTRPAPHAAHVLYTRMYRTRAHVPRTRLCQSCMPELNVTRPTSQPIYSCYEEAAAHVCTAHVVRRMLQRWHHPPCPPQLREMASRYSPCLLSHASYCSSKMSANTATCMGCSMDGRRRQRRRRLRNIARHVCSWC
jgi:hypothetical protein